METGNTQQKVAGHQDINSLTRYANIPDANEHAVIEIPRSQGDEYGVDMRPEVEFEEEGGNRE